MNRVMVMAAVAVSMMGAPAMATKTFSVDNVAVQYGGNLSGSFTTNDELTAILSLDIFAPSGVNGSWNWTAVNFTEADLVHMQIPLNSDFRLVKDGHELQLAFGLFTDAGATLTSNSYDHTGAAGNRALTGSIIAMAAVPEPATWALIIGGFGLVGGAMRRRSTKVQFA